ncbi:asparagine synthase (glutamine-hydrolyzing) [Streptomyces sp. NBC_01803]|uniref:asparagine synthase (glutamine-hydrolyzing) n=1 Tax=Streptomyces sp. NBC_01803 TaxID=2975946 RepID=UPI002DD9A1D2|nr:asparagine synthase (glutamine-hydrolyzing) [Streptomyces sp. NBC_01803]WSA43622.1 asparagine synthase (glutamine-hydrolyzing) [Streptomyces sp. NBC_01803]
MCGITGWIDWDADLRQRGPAVRAMADTLACRGPDAGGVWLSRHAALGHRRLSVIDIDGGTQPLTDTGPGAGPDDPRAVLSYNGELYNYRELRAELNALGHVFRTRSDTEVVLRAHLQWGTDAPRRFNGIFAYALWDTHRRELLLVRDHLGVKPLYWHAHATGVQFGSEPKALLAGPLFRAELDTEGIAELFALPAAPTPGHGVFRGLREVRPGHLVSVRETVTREHRYWALESRPHTDGPEATRETVRALLADTVERQLLSDVPLCTLLSGGVDSSAITALAAAARERTGRGKVTTYSVDFPGSSDRAPDAWRTTHDAPYVRAAVRHIGTLHTSVVIPDDDLLVARDAVLRARDRPGWGEMDASLHLLFREVRRRSTVALSGEAADEIFGGYPYFHDAAALASGTFPWLHDRTTPAALLRPDVRARVRPEEYTAAAYRDTLASLPEWAGDHGAESDAERRVREVFHLALTRWLPPLLDRVDRVSMSVGLEVRVPFCDHRLVEYVWNVPWALKAPGGRSKGLLRDAVRDLLPERVTDRPKSGYPSTPAVRYTEVLTARAHELLADPHAPVFELVDRAAVRRALAEGRPLPSPRTAPNPVGGLDHLVQVDEWLRAYRVSLR